MLGELSHEQIEDVLHAQVIGRIGCADGKRVYVVPVTYVYDGDAVYAHSGEGMKLRVMRANPAVCFEVEQVEDMARWRSVIAWGEFEELRGEEAVAALRRLVARLAPLMASETARPTHGADTRGRSAVLFRIRLTERTGRFEAR